MVVSDPWAAINTEVELDKDYVQGMKYAGQNDWQEALNCFRSVMTRIDHFHVFFSLYTSAEGLAKVMSGDPSGLNQCRQAVLDDPKRPDLYENLALACIRMRQRKKAVDAIAKGLRVAPNHAGLHRLRKELGYRHRPPIPFLSRDNALNRLLGRAIFSRR
jgi:tetratricopeptide (TPR) repeat protein